MELKSLLYYFQHRAFDLATIATWLLYVVVALGISVNAPQYLHTLQTMVKLYISLFLMARFNPFRQVQFTELDSKIAFSAGAFLFATTTVGDWVISRITTKGNGKEEEGNV